MKARILVVLRKLLIFWGALSIAAVLGFGALIGYQLYVGSKGRMNLASIRDVSFVLNWCGLGADRIDAVVNSYVSAQSFNGDHLDAYAIKIARLELAELSATDNSGTLRWYRGDELPPVVSDAVEFAGAWGSSEEIAWFPKESELRSADFYVYPVSIYTHGVRPTAAQLVFARPSDKMVFYFGSKT
jgi:hypothetical protein